MIEVTTSSGLKCRVNEKQFRDFRTVRAYSAMTGKGSDTDKLEGAVALVRLIMGDQEEAFLQHLEDEVGFVDTERVYLELGEIMAKIKDADEAAKKS